MFELIFRTEGDVEIITSNIEMPESVEDYSSADPNIETIIGLPDDTIIFNPGLSKLNFQQPKTLPSKKTSQTSSSFFLPNTKQTRTLSLKPPYLKVIAKNPTEKPQQIRVVHNYKPQTMKKSNQLIEIDPRQRDPREISLNGEIVVPGLYKHQVTKSHLKQKLQKIPQQPQKSNQRLKQKNPQHLKVLINSQTNSQNNQSMEQKNPQQLKLLINSQANSQSNQSIQPQINYESLIERNQSAQKRQRTLQKEDKIQPNQQLKRIRHTGHSSKLHQQTIKQEPQPTPVAVITVPYDDG